MEHLPLNWDLISRLIHERFGSKANFSRKSGIHKSTLGRWRRSDPSPSPETYLKFCGALDVDPLALIAVPAERLPAYLLKVIEESLRGHWSRELSLLSFYKDLISVRSNRDADPGHDRSQESQDDALADEHSWPPRLIPSHYPSGKSSGRNWAKRFHHHDPAKHKHSYYGSFLLRRSTDPQVWYFAFRKPGDPLFDWRWYGYVLSLDERVLLLNFTSEYMKGAHPPDGEDCVVETYLESESTDFQLISLHPFSMTFHKQIPASWRGVSVRFTHPRFP